MKKSFNISPVKEGMLIVSEPEDNESDHKEIEANRAQQDINNVD